jgi:hypothetical protein
VFLQEDLEDLQAEETDFEGMLQSMKREEQLQIIEQERIRAIEQQGGGSPKNKTLERIEGAGSIGAALEVDTRVVGSSASARPKQNSSPKKSSPNNQQQQQQQQQQSPGGRKTGKKKKRRGK